METVLRFKGIQHNVVNDAPFTGAVVIAPDCYKNCPGCQNQFLRSDYPVLESTVEKVIQEVKNNVFNQGIILAGLEWTYFPDELRALVNAGLKSDLKVMVYTYMTEESFSEIFADLCSLPIWVKFGFYDENKKTNDNIQYGIKLASSNQHIRLFPI